MTTTDITSITDRTMRGVVDSGIITEDNMGLAVTVIRAEIKALLFGDEYADKREAVLHNTIHEAYVIGLVIANCITKIGDSK